MKAILILLALGLAATACTTQRTSSPASVSHTADPSALRQTYHLIDGSFDGVNASERADAVRAEIDRHLSLRGYQALEPGDFNDAQPDIVVFYSFINKPFSLKGRVKVESAVGESYRDTRYSFANGTLMIQMKDHRSQKIFWTGCSEGVNDDPGLPQHAVQAAARSIMNKFTLLPSGYDRRNPVPKLIVRNWN